jgi:hypothetical protein
VLRGGAAQSKRAAQPRPAPGKHLVLILLRSPALLVSAGDRLRGGERPGETLVPQLRSAAFPAPARPGPRAAGPLTAAHPDAMAGGVLYLPREVVSVLVRLVAPPLEFDHRCRRCRCLSSLRGVRHGPSSLAALRVARAGGGDAMCSARCRRSDCRAPGGCSGAARAGAAMAAQKAAHDTVRGCVCGATLKLLLREGGLACCPRQRRNSAPADRLRGDCWGAKQLQDELQHLSAITGHPSALPKHRHTTIAISITGARYQAILPPSTGSTGPCCTHQPPCRSAWLMTKRGEAARSPLSCQPAHQP